MSAEFHVWVASLDLTSLTQVVQISRGVHRITESPIIGTVDIIVDNEVGSLSPALNSAMIPNAPVRVFAIDTDTTTPYELFNGFTKNFGVDPALGNRQMIISGEDRAKFFTRALTTAMQVDTNIKSMFGAIFDDIGMSAVSSVDQQMSDVVPFASYDSRAAQTALTELLTSGAHRLFVSVDGIVRVRERNEVYAQTTVNSFTDNFAAFQYSLDDSRVRNEIRISSTPRQATTDVRTISFIDQVYTIPASQEVSFWLDYKDIENNELRTPCNSVADPVATTDWLMNAAVGGGGADLTSQASLTAALFTESAKVTVRNVGSLQGYLTKMGIRGFPLQQQPTYTAVTDVASSQAAYDLQTMRISNDLIPSTNHSELYSQFLSVLLKDPIADVSVAPQKNLVPSLLSIELLDQIALAEPISGVGSLWLVMGVDHQIDMTVGQEHIATYNVIPKVTGGFLILDDPEFGKLDIYKLGF